jgi:alpha-beta hydrolase superfamily lysophospholipase
MELTITLSNGESLKGFRVKPDHPRAFIIMVHGLGEHIQRYVAWADMFVKNGIGFEGVDLPGHGCSGGKKGHIRSYGLTDQMIETLHNDLKGLYPGLPVFLYGHSLGGGLVLDYLVRKNPGFRGAIVTSPWLKLSFEPEEAKVKLAGVMKNFLPGLVQKSGLVVEHISHDKEVVEAYKNDPLVHGRISVSLFHNAMNAASNALRNASHLKIPALIMHGSDDQICSPAGSQEFASNNKLSEFILWNGGYHELHNEPFREEVFRSILAWISKNLN